jgi:hypothetical protein
MSFFKHIIYVLMKVIADSVHMCTTRKKTFKIIDGVRGTIRASRYSYIPTLQGPTEVRPKLIKKCFFVGFGQRLVEVCGRKLANFYWL